LLKKEEERQNEDDFDAFYVQSPISLFQPQTSRPLRHLFLSLPVDKLALKTFPLRQSINISDLQEVGTALDFMNGNDVFTLAVKNYFGDVIGIVDLVDITALLVSNFKKNQDPKRTCQMILGQSVSSLYCRRQSPCHMISSQASLWDVAENFVKTHQERFLIVDRNDFTCAPQTKPETWVLGILTNCDLLRFLAQNPKLMREEPVFYQSLRELGLPTRLPKTCLLTDNVGKVFTAMSFPIWERRYDGVAVLDSEGRVVWDLCSTSLKGLYKSNLEILNYTVENYIVHNKKLGWWEKPNVVSEDEPLIICVLQMVCSKSHRVYIVDEEYKPLGEIDVLDVLAELVKRK